MQIDAALICRKFKGGALSAGQQQLREVFTQASWHASTWHELHGPGAALAQFHPCKSTLPLWRKVLEGGSHENPAPDLCQDVFIARNRWRQGDCLNLKSHLTACSGLCMSGGSLMQRALSQSSPGKMTCSQRCYQAGPDIHTCSAHESQPHCLCIGERTFISISTLYFNLQSLIVCSCILAGSGSSQAGSGAV